MQKAILYEKLSDKTVQCKACSWYCTISEGSTGVCGIRENIKGDLYLLVYGKPIAVHIDPIEKKPLFHFLPGTEIFSIGTYGCNFACEFCFHPDTYIFTDHGPKLIKDIYDNYTISGSGPCERLVQGIKAITHSTGEQKILKAFCHSYKGDFYEIKPYCTPAVECTPSHKFFTTTSRTFPHIKQVRAADLSLDRHYLAIPKQFHFSEPVLLDISSFLEEQQGFYKKTHIRFDLSCIKKIINLSKKGYTSFEIGKKYNINPTYVRHLLGTAKKKPLTRHEFYFAKNKIIFKDDKIKFKTSKNWIPSLINVDENVAYLIGLFCAEGHVSKSPDRPGSFTTVFSFGKNEKNLASRTASIIKKYFNITARIKERHTTLTVETSNSLFGILFKEMCGTGAFRKHAPEFLFWAKKEIVETFINGYVAGDGYFTKDGKIAVNTISQKLAYDIYALTLKLGKLPMFYLWKPAAKKLFQQKREINQKPLYYIKWWAKRKPKQTKILETKTHYFMPIFSIKKTKYNGPVYNLAINKNHSYLANFISVSNCQNWDISQPPRELKNQRETLYKMIDACEDWPPEKIVEYCLKNKIPSIAYTYNEPAIFFEYAYDTARLAHEAGLKNVFVSNGFESREAIEKIAPYLDANNIDLKAWNSDFYKNICHAKIDPVKENIRRFFDAGVWIEITTLLIPGKNDSDEDLKSIAEFLVNISPEIPWHVTAFHPDYKMQNVPSTPAATLERAYKIGKAASLYYVYTGNIWGLEGENTHCPKCSELLIKRSGVSITENHLRDGACPKCKFKIKGIWK